MPNLKVVVDSEIHVYSAPPGLATALKAALTLNNPEYDRAARMGRSTYKIPRKLRIYSELNGKLSLPRGFWIKFAQITKQHGISIDCSDSSLEFKVTPPPQDLKMWDYQEPWINGLLSSNQGVGIAPPGCHPEGTGILMATGEIELVENVKVGDRLMGSSGPRTVLQLRRGHDDVYRVTPVKGVPFFVNTAHKLTMVWSGAGKDGEIIDPTVKKYLELSEWAKSRLKLLRCPVKSFDGETNDLPLDPYFLGLLLGDGSLKNQIGLSTMDQELVDEAQKQAVKHGVNLRVEDSGSCPTFFFGGKDYHNSGFGYQSTNAILFGIQELGLHGCGSGKKFIPHEYKTSAEFNRWQLLAGLLDSDGHLSNSVYDFVSKSKRLTDDTIFVARSLGLAAYSSVKVVDGLLYWRTCISGETHKIPCKLPRKQADPRRQIKNVGRSGFSVQKVAVNQPYYGFAVDGDHRYLLKDFTVTHNSGKTIMGLEAYARLGQPCLWLTHTKRLGRQAAKRAESFLGVKTGMIGMGEDHIEHFTVGLVPTLVRRDLSQYRDKFGLLIVDECLLPGTLIAIGGVWRPIESFVGGEKVRSVYGNKVEDSCVDWLSEKHHSGTVYQLKTANHLPITLTPNHKLQVRKRLLLREGGLGEIEVVEIQEAYQRLRRGDKLSVPIHIDRVERDVEHLTAGKLFLLGAYAAEGSCGDHQVFWSLGPSEGSFAERIVNTLKQEFGCQATIAEYLAPEVESRENTNKQLRVYGGTKEITQWFKRFVRGNCAKEKELSPILTRLPVHKQAIFLESLYEGDGHVNKSGMLEYVTASRRLALQIQQLELRAKHAAAVYKHQNTGLLARRTKRRVCYHYSVRVSKSGNFGKGARFDGDVLWLPIRWCRPNTYRGKVYNLRNVGRAHNYMTQGGVVMNCHHVPAKTFLEVVSAFDARYRYGLTATPYRDDQLEDLIFLTLGPQLAYLDRAILRKRGKLMTPTIIRRLTDLSFPYNPAVKKYNYMALADAVSTDVKRNQQIATDVIVESSMDDKNICIVLVGRLNHGELLKELIEPILPGVAFVHSKMSDKKSDAMLDDFENGKTRILIATYRMLAEGFDYQPSNRLFLTAPFKGRALIEQACGRIERVFPGKVDAVVYDYVDPLVRVLERQSEVRLDVFEASNNPVHTLQ